MRQLLRNFWEGFLLFRKSPKKYIVTLVLGVILIGFAFHSLANRRDVITDYKSISNLIAISVNGQERTFEELAFYVAYEEAQVQEMAIVYNPDNPSAYWNLHVDGVFVRLAARNAALQMAIHDELFYQMAMEDGIELSDEEKEALAMYQQDFWADLTDYDKDKRLGVDQETVYQCMERMMYAQVYQEIYANIMGQPIDDFDFSAEAYQELYDEAEIEINNAVWEQLRFGSITL